MFATSLNRSISPHLKIGESWDVCDREESSVVLNSGSKGRTLRNLIEEDAHSLLGPRWKKNEKFPLLVKWLDCSERLSLQVHPPLPVAKKLNGQPKTENWYVASSSSDAALFAGLKRGTTKEDFVNAINNQSLEQHCHKVSSEAGDSLLVQSGRVHAIDAGNLILEIQQNSDTTYRVFDWGRRGLDGKFRELHVEESLQSIDFEDFEPTVTKTSKELGIFIITQCDEFRIRKFNADAKAVIKLKPKYQDCSIIHAVSGEVAIHGTRLLKGEHGLSPYSECCDIVCKERTTFLVTDRFI